MRKQGRLSVLLSVIAVITCILFSLLPVNAGVAELSTNLNQVVVYNARNRKLVESKTYVDADGNPVIASDKGYATIRYSYTSGNKVSQIEYLDTKGKPINSAEGYAVRKDIYRSKKLEEQYFYDADGKLVTGPDGYAWMKTRYLNGKHASTWRYDPDGNPVGWHRITEYAQISTFQMVTSDTWYDADGNLTAGPDGYARVEYS